LAHSPEKKAEAVYDLVNGMTWDDAAAKHKVSKATLKDWLDKAKTELKPNRPRSESELTEPPASVTAEGRRARFNGALDAFLMATIQMVDAWAIGCADPQFFKGNPEGASELGRIVLERADKLVSVVNGDAKPGDGL
jgi:transposase-like protein